MFWEIYQQQQIATAQRTASSASSKAAKVQSQIEQLENRVDSLSLICQGMWELLSERTEGADALLEAKVREIDARDGKLDGKIRRVMTPCSDCSRPLHHRHRRCMYCGANMQTENLFQE